MRIGEDLEFPTPCDMQWDEMSRAGEEGRFCERCQHHVVDISALTRAQWEEMFARDDNMCARAILDKDGLVQFKPDEPQLRRQQRGLDKLMHVAATISTLSLVGLAACDRPVTQSQDSVDVQAKAEPAKLTQPAASRVPPKTSLPAPTRSKAALEHTEKAKDFKVRKVTIKDVFAPSETIVVGRVKRPTNKKKPSNVKHQ